MRPCGFARVLELYIRGFAQESVLQSMMVIAEVMVNGLGICHTWRDSMGQRVHRNKELKAMYGECVAAAADDSAVFTGFQHLRAAEHRIERCMTPLSRSALNLTGLLEFATKPGIRRRGSPEGRAAYAFLQTTQAPVILLAGLMADAGAEVLGLVRALSTENRPTTHNCGSINDFLSRTAGFSTSKAPFQSTGTLPMWSIGCATPTLWPFEAKASASGALTSLPRSTLPCGTQP